MVGISSVPFSQTSIPKLFRAHAKIKEAGMQLKTEKMRGVEENERR